MSYLRSQNNFFNTMTFQSYARTATVEPVTKNTSFCYLCFFQSPTRMFQLSSSFLPTAHSRLGSRLYYKAGCQSKPRTNQKRIASQLISLMFSLLSYFNSRLEGNKLSTFYGTSTTCTVFSKAHILCQMNSPHFLILL